MRLAVILLLLFISNLYGQADLSAKYSKSITSKELKELLYVYASDYFEGRDTGERGQKIAVDFLRNYYQKQNIEAAINTKNYFQEMILNIRGKNVKTENVVAIIPGSENPEEYIVISAHLDHVGQKNGQIYNGADDDGSGTVAILEIAEAFKEAENNGHGPDRSIVFLHVTAEEIGLIGSRYYTDEDPIVPLKNTVTNLNIDMIGRTDPERPKRNREYIYIIGSDRISQDLHDINHEVNDLYLNIDLDYVFNAVDDPNRFYYRSDHYNFAKNGVPAIFYFSGTHEDYHQPTDTVEKIQYDLLELRTKLIFHTAWEIANRKDRIKSN